MKGCKPCLQEACQQTLDVVLSASMRASFEIDLWPETPQCSLPKISASFAYRVCVVNTAFRSITSSRWSGRSQMFTGLPGLHSFDTQDRTHSCIVLPMMLLSCLCLEVDVARRWDQCKQLTRAQQRFETGQLVHSPCIARSDAHA